MTVRDLRNSISWEVDEIVLEVWDENHDEMLCEWGWFCDFDGGPAYEDFADRLWYDALDCEVKYIYTRPDKFEDGRNSLDTVVLHIDAKG